MEVFVVPARLFQFSLAPLCCSLKGPQPRNKLFYFFSKLFESPDSVSESLLGEEIGCKILSRPIEANRPRLVVTLSDCAPLHIL